VKTISRSPHPKVALAALVAAPAVQEQHRRLRHCGLRRPQHAGHGPWKAAEQEGPTEDYHSALAHTGHGSWKVRDDAHLWRAFILRAHHMQAQTLARRVDEAGQTWAELEALTAAGILAARGTGRGRHYVASPVLREIGERRRSARNPIRDPYTWMRPRLAEPAALAE
jgi:hypothetical protein